MRPRSLVLTALLVLSGSRVAQAQLVIRGGDTNIRLGVLGQFWADAVDPEDSTTDETERNLFVRRLRVLLGGDVAKNVAFFIETDAPNLGRTLPGGKNITPSVIVQDAFASVRAAQAFTLDAGLMFVPFSRNSVQSAATLLPIDYGAYTFAQSGPTVSSTGRDTGFQARGYLAQDRVEYRIGAFQGMKNASATNDLRYAGRIQVNLLDSEVGFFYTGTNLGNKRVIAIGAAFDSQSRYHGYDADAFVDLPLGSASAITAQFDYNRLNGRNTLTAIPDQHDWLAEAGWLIRRVRLTPFVQLTRRDLVDLSAGDEHRESAGLAYWWAAHNTTVKGAYTRITPSAAASQNEFTVQLQVFVY
jgi:hypothetical protein